MYRGHSHVQSNISMLFGTSVKNLKIMLNKHVKTYQGCNTTIKHKVINRVYVVNLCPYNDCTLNACVLLEYQNYRQCWLETIPGRTSGRMDFIQ